MLIFISLNHPQCFSFWGVLLLRNHFHGCVGNCFYFPGSFNSYPLCRAFRQEVLLGTDVVLVVFVVAIGVFNFVETEPRVTSSFHMKIT